MNSSPYSLEHSPVLLEGLKAASHPTVLTFPSVVARYFSPRETRDRRLCRRSQIRFMSGVHLFPTADLFLFSFPDKFL